jgi:hypothetical protein
MILVGITGAIDHGKTSFADFLQAAVPGAAHYESSELIMEVANALRSSGPTPYAENVSGILTWLQALPGILASAAHVEVSFEALNISADRFATASQEFGTLFGYLHLMELQPELTTKPINQANKDDFRILLQWIGGYFVKNVSGRIWFDEMVRRSVASAAPLAVISGVRFLDDATCVREAGGVIINIIRPNFEQQELQDVTESERIQITSNCTVTNDSTLVALQAVAVRIYADLSDGTLQTNYQANAY